MAAFTCSFWPRKKKFKDLSLAEFVYGYLDIMRRAPGGSVNSFNDIDGFGSQL